MNLLLVEDDEILSEVVASVLSEEGHSVVLAHDCATARTHFGCSDFDAVILDVMLPDGTGLELLGSFREEGERVPVLMLTSLDTPEDVIRGLDAGADDYLTKPFEPAVLAARIRALLRRTATAGPETLRRGDLSVDRLGRIVKVGDRPVRLTPKEYALLEHLILGAGRTIDRPELLEKVWKLTFDPGSNVVDAHLARLRAKLNRAGAGDLIVTVRGGGFRIPLDEERSGSGEGETL